MTDTNKEKDLEELESLPVSDAEDEADSVQETSETEASDKTKKKDSNKSAKEDKSSDEALENHDAKAGRKLPEKPKKSVFEKIVSIVLWVLAGIIVFLIGVRCYFRIPVGNYYKASDRTFTIPDTGNGFIAQGLSYDENGSRFLVTGYMKDGSASPIYVINKSKSIAQQIAMADPAGIPLNIHAGGLSVYGDYVYVTGSGTSLYVYSYGKIMTAGEGATVSALAEIEIPDIRTAWTTVSDGYLIVGEFHREKNYPTPDSHKLTTPCGDKNEALAVAFRLSEEAEYGLDTTPCFAYSLPDKVQGMAINEGKIYLSTSYAASFSHILIYDNISSRAEENKGTLSYNGMDIPVYYCDSTTLLSNEKIPPMSEEIEFVDGKMYTMCESASDKYIFGKLTGARKVYATDMNKLILLGKDNE